MTERRKRLIEVAFPIEEVSEYSRLDPYQGAPHPRVIHLWWARRPLAACRAFIYASLVNDPETDAQREELLKEVADLASWDAVRKPDQVVRAKPKGTGMTGHELLRRARERILRDNNGKAPRMLDPFAGGGAIPLEALRLGCEVEASDLNPVAVLILKATVEYPQTYGRPLSEQREKHPDDCAGVNSLVPKYIRDLEQNGGRLPGLGGDTVEAYERNPIATDLRYWGHWILEHARAELAQFYPSEPDGALPVAYLWSRTVPCPNCAAEMPLIRQYWLARKDKKKVALKPVIDRPTNRVEFEIVEGDSETSGSEEATTNRGDTICLMCRQAVKAEYVRQAGRDGYMREIPTAVVLEAAGKGGKRYRADNEGDRQAFEAARDRLGQLGSGYVGELSLVPDEPMPTHLTGGVITGFGYDTFGKLFNPRQMLVHVTFARLVGDAWRAMQESGLSVNYSRAVATLLALTTDRLPRENSTITRWNPTGEKAQGAFGQQAFPMVWDYAELNHFGGSVGDAAEAISMVASALDLAGTMSHPARVAQRPAQQRAPGTFDSVLTDPPYYDAINYSDLSDFFYVWLRRSAENIHPDLLALPLTPKQEQAVMTPHLAGSRQTARSRYVETMTAAFSAISASTQGDGLVGVVFAHSDPDGWATLIEGLLSAAIVPEASWPLDTEMGSKVAGQGQARLSTSVWMACRPRSANADSAFIDDIREELRREVEGKLLDFWRRGIRGADFFISAIGPALAVFGRHSKVLHPDGSDVSVREFLDIVRQESARVALQQVLHGENLGAIDPATRAFVMWVWSYGKAALDAGEAIAHCLATGADLGEITRPHAIAETATDKSKKVVKLRSIAARAREDEELGRGNGARNTPLIDELQYAAFLWGAGKAATDLSKYRASVGEERWKALRILGQAVAECLPDGDDDRRIILGLLGSGAASGAAPAVVPGTQSRMELG